MSTGWTGGLELGMASSCDGGCRVGSLRGIGSCSVPCVCPMSWRIDLGCVVALIGKNFLRNFLLRNVVRFEPSIFTMYWLN